MVEIPTQTTQAVLFDLDGTLADSMHIWRDIDISFFNSRNIPFPDAKTEIKIIIIKFIQKMKIKKDIIIQKLELKLMHIKIDLPSEILQIPINLISNILKLIKDIKIQQPLPPSQKRQIQILLEAKLKEKISKLII